MAAAWRRLPNPEISAVERTADGLMVEFNRGHAWLVPYLVLRDSCPSAFNPRSGFLVLKTPAPIAALIKRMGDPDPKKRPTALEATRALEATGLARPAPEGGCCALS